jgi:tetratricopeptide (TPR) repeat protein
MLFIAGYLPWTNMVLRYCSCAAKKQVQIPVFLHVEFNVKVTYCRCPGIAGNYLNGKPMPFFTINFMLYFSRKFTIMYSNNHLKATRLALVFSAIFFLMDTASVAQMLQLPDGGVNLKSKAGRRVGVTDIEINWDAPGVKGREGKIWGTDVANYGFMVLGFGSTVQSPWRAGANENTTFSFSTDVTINGKPLAAGKYGFFIALYPDSCVLIFNKNTAGWGSYFYNSALDVMRVTAWQQKDMKESRERLEYTFSKHTDRSVEVALEWEKWRIPFKVETDLTATTLASIRTQLSGAMGFDPPSLEAAAAWCLQNNLNYEQALGWINAAVDPNMGGVTSFRALSTKAGLLAKLNKKDEADKIMQAAMENGSVQEMHSYGRQLLNEKRVKEAMAVFEKNYKKFNGAWPTNAGMMRGYSAMGDLKKALEHAKMALAQSPNEQSKKTLQDAITTLESGKAL